MQKWVVVCCVALVALACVASADECPDGGRCEEGQTCCKHPTKGYECCPFDQGECCGDHVHCCPAGFTCDLDWARCVNSSGTTPWAQRTPAGRSQKCKSFRMIKSYIGEEDDNICPDQSRCPAEFSCQRALTKYGCCPLAQGIPCSDGKHCCPEGHSCSEDGRLCIKKEVATTVLCSDGISECPEDSSCCKGRDGQFSCCPMKQAVYCEDDAHCCPEGTSCDLENARCVSNSTNKALPMWAKFPARKRAVWENQKEDKTSKAAKFSDAAQEEVQEEFMASVTVPSPGERAANGTCDTDTTCPRLSTCCSDGDGGSHCCPYDDAVCCSDSKHCCPYGTICDLTRGQCLGPLDFSTGAPSVTVGDLVAVDFKKEDEGTSPANPALTVGGMVLIDDFLMETEEERDSLMDYSEYYYDEEFSVSTPQPREFVNVTTPSGRLSDVICDQTYSCPDETTCCSDGQGGWGCCPNPNAVCCSDHVHCCPSGTTCDVAHLQCLSSSDSTTATSTTPTTTPMIPRAAPITTAAPALTEESHTNTVAITKNVTGRVSDVICDQTYSCPDETTCCSDGQGGWGCCPEPNAVCCSDHVHCCPSGTTCDMAHLQCLSSSDSTTATSTTPTTTPMIPRAAPITTAAPALTEESHTNTEAITKNVTGRVSDVICDQTYSCPDETTCCSDGQGGWGCCPEPNAVCCSDHVHCCPSGTTCDMAHLQCLSSSDSTTAASTTPTTTPMIPRAAPITTAAPALTEECHTNTVAITKTIERVSNVTCDTSYSCPDQTTCCPGRQGDWRCCPGLNAVCCRDHYHCCPQGTICDLAHVRCANATNSDSTTPMSPRAAAVTTDAPAPTEEEKEEEEKKEEEGDMISCDRDNSCPKGSTCCRLGPTWGCCPLPQAVCCSDDKHCCPHEYRCSSSHQACVRDSESIPWYPKLPAVFRPESDTGDVYVKCADGKSCPQYNTCCQRSSGEYGCCPMENAVCCSDKKHCCPTNYTCDSTSQKCKRSILVVVGFIPLTPAKTQTEDQTQTEIQVLDQNLERKEWCRPEKCPKCCKVEGKAFCCPYKNGVCCSKSLKCCPSGQRCHWSGRCASDLWPFYRKKEEKPLIL